MSKTIKWTRTGGKNHCVIITSQEVVDRAVWLAMNAPISYAGAENAYLGPEWAFMQQQAVNVPKKDR